MLSKIDIRPFGEVNVEVRPDLCSSTHRAFAVSRGNDRVLVVHSLTALTLGLAGVVWHDDSWRCPTWTGDDLTGSCRCDVEGSGRG